MICPKRLLPGVRLSLLLATLISLASGCDHNFCPCDPDPPVVPMALPLPTSPENVIEALEITYNDKIRRADERLMNYSSLFTDTFIFRLQPDDVAQGLPEQWGLRDELAIHEQIFDAQDRGDIYSIELVVDQEPARDLVPPVSGREGWKEVFAPIVYLRLMFGVWEGIEVNGSQARFLFAPPERGRFKIAGWSDLSDPSPGKMDATTWGRLKLHYRPEELHGID